MDPTPESQIPEPPAEATPAQDEPGGERQESITRPAKLLRIASMVRELLEETRQTSSTSPGGSSAADLRAIGRRARRGVVRRPEGGALRARAADAGRAERRRDPVAQAQLVGWLEGLFHGIQAALFAQQAAAREQFEELRRRGLPSGAEGPQHVPDVRGGQYL
jgi:hypothetical protein